MAAQLSAAAADKLQLPDMPEETETRAEEDHHEATEEDVILVDADSKQPDLPQSNAKSS
jgi:hypothetical protein